MTTLEILDKNIALVRISRPEAKNALDPKTLRELAAIWQQVAEDERIRVAILTGTGDAFCAGMDLKKTIPLAKRLASGELSRTRTSKLSRQCRERRFKPSVRPSQLLLQSTGTVGAKERTCF